MSLYPSLEDMKVDQLIQAQHHATQPSASASTPPSVPSSSTPSLPYPIRPDAAPVYPGLAEFMGLEMSQDMIRENMPEYLINPSQAPKTQVSILPSPPGPPGILGGGGLVAPVSGSSTAVAKNQQLNHGIRQVILCKDADGKVGLRVKSINKGIFVCLVTRDSPAAMGGLRFGDQILQINSENVAGFSEGKVHDIFKKASVNNIVLAVRDRPFERTLTLHKDSTGHLGFQYKDGKITTIIVNSSAARNGMLIDHNLLEINGQNVVGLKDKEVAKIIDEGGQTLTVTVIPNFLFQHMVKNMSCSLVKKMMDHSLPDM